MENNYLNFLTFNAFFLKKKFKAKKNFFFFFVKNFKTKMFYYSLFLTLLPYLSQNCLISNKFSCNNEYISNKKKNFFFFFNYLSNVNLKIDEFQDLK